MPDLVVEGLSPGKANEDRDCFAKLQLYSIQGVLEYWIVDRITQRLEIYCRSNAQLTLAATLLEVKLHPLLPGFNCNAAHLYSTESLKSENKLGKSGEFSSGQYAKPQI